MHELQYPACTVQVLADVKPVRLTCKPEEKVGFLVRKGHWTSLVVAANADRVQMHYDPQVGTSVCRASCMPLIAAVDVRKSAPTPTFAQGHRKYGQMDASLVRMMLFGVLG